MSKSIFSDATLQRFAREVAKYPSEQKQSAVMACLSIVQQEQGWVSPESERGIAEVLGMAPIAVHEVTTFYNMYNQQPVGKFKLNVCTNLPCQLRDGQKALDHLCSKLGIEQGGTTADIAGDEAYDLPPLNLALAGQLVGRSRAAKLLDELRQDFARVVFHAGTAQRDKDVVTAGGRVLGILGRGPTLSEAQREAYRVVNTISFEGCHFRADIAHRALKP